METVTSKDGTRIAFDRVGSGPPVVLVCGASVARGTDAHLAELLSDGLTVLNYDRRGRGDSTDTAPYAIEREVEDLAAVIDAAGGSAGVWGSSSGGALALIAADQGLPIAKLALWEPPFVPDGFPKPPSDQVEQYQTMIAEGRRGDAVEYFMTEVVGMPAEFAAQARSQPWWGATEAIAHTLSYDARIMRSVEDPAQLASRVKVPTLVNAGTVVPWMEVAATALGEALPEGRVGILEGQSHDVDMTVLAPVLKEFFA
jgi:alpha-beta hydrolase superfamily lysophospholipase